MKETYCSILSAQAGEILYGTASQTRVYILVEYSGAWEEKALAKSSLPEDVKQRLNNFSKSRDDAKVLLIKNGASSPDNPINFFLAAPDETSPRLYQFQLNSYSEILDLDFLAILSGSLAYSANLTNNPLYLVCTNGRRDVCCARFGYPVYEALSKLVSQSAWECTHVGGHRFAANILHLPFALLYGRVQPQDAANLVNQIQTGNIQLENLRGRTIYPQAAQVGEYFLRRQIGELNLEAFHLLDARETNPGTWQVRFQTTQNGAEYNLNISIEKVEASIYDSCLLDKQTPIRSYHIEM